MWTDDPWPWIDGTVLEDVYDPEREDLGFYHVTTRYSAVARSGKLMARADLTDIIGLGSGPSDTVSFVANYDMAETLAGRIQWVARVAQGQIEADEIVKTVFDWLDWPNGVTYQDRFEHAFQGEDAGYSEEKTRLQEHLRELADMASLTPADGDDLTRADVWQQLIRDQLRGVKVRGSTGYSMVQEIEKTVELRFLDWDVRSEADVCLPVVGFTASYNAFRRIDPEEVGIVQAQVRTNAHVELFPSECELRVKPKDIEVIGGIRDPWP